MERRKIHQLRVHRRTTSNLAKNERNTLRIINGCRKILKKNARDASVLCLREIAYRRSLSLSLDSTRFQVHSGWPRIFRSSCAHAAGERKSARLFSASSRDDLTRVTSSSHYKCFKGLTSRRDE